jgi:hypothetical protein
MRKPRVRGLAKLQQLIDQQKVLQYSHRFEVVSFKGLPTNLLIPTGIESKRVGSQKSSYTNRKPMATDMEQNH